MKKKFRQLFDIDRSCQWLLGLFLQSLVKISFFCRMGFRTPSSHNLNHRIFKFLKYRRAIHVLTVNCFGVYSCSWTTFALYDSFNSDFCSQLNFRLFFSCDSSSIGSNVGRSVGWLVGRSVGRLVRPQRVSAMRIAQYGAYIR